VGTKNSRKRKTKNSRRKMSPFPELLSAAMDTHLSASPNCQSPWAEHKDIVLTKAGNDYYCALCGAAVLIQRAEPPKPRTPAQLRRLIDTALKTPHPNHDQVKHLLQLFITSGGRLTTANKLYAALKRTIKWDKSMTWKF